MNRPRIVLAFLSDIHGNLPALRAAAEHARARGAAQILCAGDLLGYGPFPDEVADYIRTNSILSIAGNYDMKILHALHHPEKYRQAMKPFKWKILHWTQNHISPSTIRFLDSLPLEYRMRLPNDQTLLLVHGSPLSPKDTVYPSITTSALRAKTGNSPPHVLVTGHTHIPFIKRFRNCLVVNCGSVGQPVDGDPRGAYALLTAGPSQPPTAKIIRFSYPVETTVSAIRHAGLPEYLERDYRNGTKTK